MKQHLKKHSREEKLHKCNHCNSAFHRVDHLERHFRTHQKESKKCNQCNYSTAHEEYMRKHLTKCKKCNHCEYATSHKMAFRIHMKTHAEEKKCSDCELSTTESGLWKRHSKIHPYENANDINLPSLPKCSKKRFSNKTTLTLSVQTPQIFSGIWLKF